MKVFPVILAGGSGSRLWPLSRKDFPKQFLSLHGEHSLLQKTLLRARYISNEEILVVGNEGHYFLCQEQLSKLHNALTYILEPCPKNTAPAIASAAHHIQNSEAQDGILVVLPSDHWVQSDEALASAITQAIEYVQKYPVIATFGIQPTSPKTGFGYVDAGNELAQGIYQIERFREKPTLEIAETCVAQKNSFWNSGMFVCRASTYLEALQIHMPNMFEQTKAAYENAQVQYDFIRLDESAFSLCESESVDYAIMEKTKHAVIAPLALEWNDLGSWSAIFETNAADENGNVLTGNVLAEKSTGCLVRSEQALVTTLGISDQIIIATPDAVLVADKSYAEQVKDIVASFTEEHQSLAESHTCTKRPWGTFEILAEGKGFKVKRLMLHPGAKISLQRHEHRAEHWVVVSGIAEIINGTAPFQLGVNQSTYIPPKTIHRLSNPGDEPLYVIEVQSGSYLGEDDITRYDDIYARATESHPAKDTLSA